MPPTQLSPRCSPSPSSSRRLAAFLLLALAPSLAGCGQQAADAGAGQKAPETVDIAPAISVPTDGDVEAAAPRKGLVGVLPNDFPRDLPIYLPSSVIDFGKKDGRRFVLLQSPDPRPGVEAWLRRAAADAGYRVEGQGGRLQLRKGERRVTLGFAGQGTSEFRYEY